MRKTRRLTVAGRSRPFRPDIAGRPRPRSGSRGRAGIVTGLACLVLAGCEPGSPSRPAPISAQVDGTQHSARGGPATTAPTSGTPHDFQVVIPGQTSAHGTAGTPERPSAPGAPGTMSPSGAVASPSLPAPGPTAPTGHGPVPPPPPAPTVLPRSAPPPVPGPAPRPTTRAATTPPAAKATVPNVRGLTRSEATDTLHRAGFYNISFSEGCSTNGEHEKVNGQTPEAGTPTTFDAPVGMHIHILNCVSIPDVVGMPMGSAVDYLGRLGWTPVAGQGCAVGDNSVVAAMTPASGSYARPGSRIQLDPKCR
ncbi:PASTA domain-containing protein [Frankia sp. Hr75.2]|nr:PASTA domain-containing protein [Frankia sp. Hr75.2]